MHDHIYEGEMTLGTVLIPQQSQNRMNKVHLNA